MNLKKLLASSLVSIVASVSLTACVPTAIVTGATAGGAVIYNKRSIKTMFKDQQISSRIESSIRQNPDLKKQTNINATTCNGITLLTGEARTAPARNDAVKLANKVKGVRILYNEIIIGKLAGFRSRARSSLLTSQVKAALLAKPGVRSTQIKVTSARHTVYLMGIVSHTQAALAAKVASRVSGVNKVVKVFEYDN